MPDEPQFPNIDLDTFERLVIDELDALPDEVVDRLENVVFLVEDRPEQGWMLGVYEGIDLTERGSYDWGPLPDRIILFREPLLEFCSNLAELKHEIHVTLVHEIGHYYGIDDAKLHDLGWG